MAVLVLNKGEDALEVNVTGGNFFKGLKILKHRAKRVRDCDFNLLFPKWKPCVFLVLMLYYHCFFIRNKFLFILGNAVTF